MIFNTKPKVPSLAEMLADQRRKRIAAYRDKVRYTKTYEMECEIEEYLAAEAAKEQDARPAISGPYLD